MPEDKQYSVFKRGEYANQAIINDLPTGIEQFMSKWNDGLHQFIELKHSQVVNPESLQNVYMSNLSYLKLYKNRGHIFGMTGTLGELFEKQFLQETLNVEYFTLPRFKRRLFYYDRPQN